MSSQENPKPPNLQVMLEKKDLIISPDPNLKKKNVKISIY